MARLSVGDLTKRYNAAWSRKETFRDLYEQCYEYALPQRNLYDGYYDGKVGGRKKGSTVFDSTAVHGVQRFANRIQSGLFPPDRKWMVLEPGTDIPEESRADVADGLQKYTHKFFSLIRQTNFDLAMGEFLMDLCVGTGVMLVQAGDDLEPIRFQSIPQFLVALEEGPNGNVENVYRRVRVAAENITRIWEDAELPEVLRRVVEDEPHKPIDLQESTIRNGDGSFGYYICYKGEQDRSDDAMLVYRELKSSPWIVSRFQKIAGEIYGRGPVVACLADILTLNKAVELLLKNASLGISGMYTAVDDGVLNPQTIRVAPGAIIPVARNAGPAGPSLMPLPRAGDLQLSQIVLQDLRMNIKRTLLDDSLPPDNMSARSATEIVERMRELATNLGSAFGRLISETMVPLVRRSMSIMDDAGLITLPLKINGLEVKVVPVSPLAQAQNMTEVQDVLQWIGISSQLGPVGQAMINYAAVSDFVADKLGVPLEVRTTQEERAEIEEQAMQFIQQQQAGMPMQPPAAPPPEGVI